jgi:hypothetical protein
MMDVAEEVVEGFGNDGLVGEGDAPARTLSTHLTR